MTAHAELGASSASRWINCAGSVALARPYAAAEGRSSFYAAEGTVTHAVAEAALNGVSLPAIGAVLEVDEHRIVVTHEMLDAVDTYLGVVIAIREKSSWHASEQRVTIHSAPLQAELFGTLDFAALTGRTLHIVDLKYGKGVIVEVEENTQELYYALAAYETFEEIKDEVREIRLVIVQPRIDGARIKEWTIDLLDLLIWRESVLLPAVKRIINGDETLNDGPWCRFCPALAFCPLKHQLAQDAARKAFGSNSGDMTPEELGDRLRLAQRLQGWIVALEEEATTFIRKGEDIPGWKLVEGRSNRRWATDNREVWQTIMQRAGVDTLKAEQLFEPPQLKSPFQAERVIKGWKRDPKVILEDLVNRPAGKPTLVQESDPRPAMQFLTAMEQFRLSAETEV